MRTGFLFLPLLMAGMMIFEAPAAAAGRCPLGDKVPITDARGVVKVCDAFGNVLTVRGFPPGKRVPVNRLFKTMYCPSVNGSERTGWVEPHEPRRREAPWPPGVTPMHFNCDVAMRRLDGSVVPLPRKAARRSR